MTNDEEILVKILKLSHDQVMAGKSYSQEEAEFSTYRTLFREGRCRVAWLSCDFKDKDYLLCSRQYFVYRVYKKHMAFRANNARTHGLFLVNPFFR